MNMYKEIALQVMVKKNLCNFYFITFYLSNTKFNNFKIIDNEDEEPYNNPNLHSKDQDELEIP